MPRRRPADAKVWLPRAMTPESKTDFRDDFTVLCFTDRREAHSLKECFGSAVTGFIDHVDAIHAALSGFIEQVFNREPSNTAALVTGVDVDPPQH